MLFANGHQKADGSRGADALVRVGVVHGLRLLLRVFLLVAFFDCLFEVAYAFAQPFAEVGKFTRAKQQQRDSNDQQNMQRLE